MIALCHKHHRLADTKAISREELYRLKTESKTRDSISDQFIIKDWSKFTIALGARMAFEGCYRVLQVENEAVLGFARDFDRLALSLHLKDEQGRSLLLIEDNDWLVNVDDIWDCHVQGNRITVQDRTRRYYVKFHLNADQAEVSINFRIHSHGVDFKADENGLSLGGINHVWKNFRYRGFAVAFHVYKNDTGNWAYKIGVRYPTLSLDRRKPGMSDILLTKHEGMHFEAQTVYVSGNAYLNCTFTRCTLVLTNVPSHLEKCSFSNCNWDLDYLVLWGDSEGRSALRGILDLIDGASQAEGCESAAE